MPNKKKKQEKPCPRCNKTLPIGSFMVFGPKNPQGREHSYCFRCQHKTDKKTNFLNSATIKNAGKTWAERNPDKIKVSKVNYRARTRYKSSDLITFEGWQSAKLFAKNRCLKCGSTTNLTPDHVMPLASGGRNIDSNIQCLCFGCNSAKQAATTDYRITRT